MNEPITGYASARRKGECWFLSQSDFENFLQILGTAERPKVALFEGACDRVAQLPTYMDRR